MKYLARRTLLLLLPVLSTLGCGQPLVEFPLDEAPSVVSTIPADEATGVQPGGWLHVLFSSDMDAATINSDTFSLARGETPVPATVTYQDKMAVLKPESLLLKGTTFTATVTTGATDLDGEPLLEKHVWSFETATGMTTNTPPEVVSTAPENGTLDAPIDSVVEVEFSEAMDAATIDDATFLVMAGPDPVPGVVSYAGNTATFTPTNLLAEGTTYTATITTGAKDVEGAALEKELVWTFQTTSNTPPEVLSAAPTNGTLGVATSAVVKAEFNEAMHAATLDDTTFLVMAGADPVLGVVSYAGNTATFTPTDLLTEGTTYTATITTGAKDVEGAPLTKEFVWTFQTGSMAVGEQIPLGSASTFAVLAFNTITNVNNPGTIVTGDLGISPGAALVGFPPGEVIGEQHLGDVIAATAKVDLLTAYNDAAGRLGAAVLPGDLSGLTIYPGLYKASTSTMLSAGNVTLDAQGDENALFLFQMGSTFTSNAGTQVVLSGGAKAANVYWSVGTSATLGTGSIFKGTLLVGSAITAKTGATIEGRLLALGAAVELDTNVITVPAL